MQWTCSETMTLAAQKCAYCDGSGLVQGRKGKSSPCACVFRAIFRACYGKFRSCVQGERSFKGAVHEAGGRGARCGGWGFKDEEFVADFCLVSRRALNDAEYRVFRYHFLLGADWRLCCRRLRVERGVFFHTVYRIERKLGRVFGELKPYALWPLDEYFNGTTLEITSSHQRRNLAFRPVRPVLNLPAADKKAA